MTSTTKSPPMIAYAIAMGGLSLSGAVAKLCLAFAMQALAQSPINPPIAPLLQPYERTIQVSTTTQLVNALNQVTPGQAILLADGTYDVSGVEPLRLRRDSIMLYGASRDPSKVILKGQGFTSGNRNEEMIKVEGVAATLAYITIRDVRANGLKIQSGANHNLLVHNVHFIDINERSIKGPDVPVSRGGIIRYCLFEQQTAITPSIPNLAFNGDYIAGMDLMKIEDWRIHDNVFLNIKGMNGGGRGAVFLWVGCKNVTVERNLFMGCDRAISLGNPSGTNDMVGGLVRNNFIVAGKDISIEVCNATSTRILHNTIFSSNPSFNRTVSFYNGGAGNVLKNNLVLGRFSVQGGAAPDTAGNLWLSSNGESLFLNPVKGDLHLAPGANQVIDKGVQLEEVPLDWDGKGRTSNPDIGADEWSGNTGLRRRMDAHVSAVGGGVLGFRASGRFFHFGDSQNLINGRILTFSKKLW